MNICSSGHDEICFEGKNCLGCELTAQVDNLSEQIESLQDEIIELKEEK